MTRTRKLLAATALASVLPAAVAGAATIPATPASLKLDGAYAYLGTIETATHAGLRDKPNVIVVFKTHGQLPRRFDGLIRAGAQLGSHGGGSIGSVGGRTTRCYTFSIPLNDGRFYGSDGGTGARAAAGSRLTLKVSADDASGDTISSSKTLTLRKQRAGDASGRPVGC